MKTFPDLMRETDDHLHVAMREAGGSALRGRFVDALLDRAERLYAEVFGHDQASARHAIAARRAAERATAARGRCRR